MSGVPCPSWHPRQTWHEIKTQVLVQALPYIQKYYNKVVVIKYGGNAMINEDLKNAVMSDLVLRQCRKAP